MNLTSLRDLPPWEWPSDARARVLEVLLDDEADPSRKLLAAELAANITLLDDEVARALLKLVADPEGPELLRGRAALSLGPGLEFADAEGFDLLDENIFSEDTFNEIQDALHALYIDPEVPTGVRRQVLEASVRAARPWHAGAVRAAYFTGEPSWVLTAVYCMRFIPGFQAEILDALGSEDHNVLQEAVRAAGEWELDAAWPFVQQVLTEGTSDRSLLLAAIEASARIRPREAPGLLAAFAETEDREIEEAVFDALCLAEWAAGGGGGPEGGHYH